MVTPPESCFKNQIKINGRSALEKLFVQARS